VSLLEGLSVDDLDGGQDEQKGYKSLLHGVAPKIHYFSSFQEEVNFVAGYLKEMGRQGQELNGVCLVARTHELLKQYEAALKESGVGTCFIRRSEAEDRRVPGLRLATMHRVKGLEFERVIITGVNDGLVPYEKTGRSSSDPVVQRESEVQERALLYVAATRAKLEVLVTTHGPPSRYLAPFIS
jgi:superfamily I DNA/RNA helicase